MVISFEELPNEPILIAKFSDPLDALQDTQILNKTVAQALAKIDTDLYLIADMSEASIGFSDIVIGLGAASRGDMAFFKAERLKMVAVGMGEVVTRMSQFARQKQYGEWVSVVLPTVDEALEYCRESNVKQT
jgi:hypothetical protein